MKYGSYIKNIRQILDIKQKDLTNCNLSKNLLSNIEKDKTNLVPQKAIMIFKTAVEISLSKNIYIDIDFDELLNDNECYTCIKEAYEKCFELKGRIAYKKFLKEEELGEIHSLVRRNTLGMVTFYLYYHAARLVEHCDVLKLNTYFHALHFLKWQPMAEHLELFKKTLMEVRAMAETHGRYNDLYYFFETLKNAEASYTYRINPSTFMYLGQYAYELNMIKNSIGYLQDYQENIVDQKPEEYFEIYEKLAKLYLINGQKNKALKILTKDLDKLSYKKYLPYEVCYRALIIKHAMGIETYNKDILESSKRLLEINELQQGAMTMLAYEVLLEHLVCDDYLKLASKVLDDAYENAKTEKEKCHVLYLELVYSQVPTDKRKFIERALTLSTFDVAASTELEYAKVMLKAHSSIASLDDEVQEAYYIKIESLKSSM